MADADSDPRWLPALKKAFDASDMNMKQLSEASGVGYDRLNKIMRGESKQPRGDALERIFTALGIGDRYVRENLVPVNFVSEGQTPVLGEVAAGAWLEYGFDMIEPLEWFTFSLPKYPARSVYGLRVKGDSIDKVAADGQILVVVDLASTGISLQDRDLAIVERRKGQEGTRELTAKRVRLIDGEYWLVPESTNPRWQAQRFRLNDGGPEIELHAIARVEFVLSRP